MKPLWPKISAPFVRTLLSSHSALGLFIAALTYLVCLTGTVAVFVDELGRWETTRTPEASALPTGALQRAVNSGVARAGPGEITSLWISLPTESAPRTMVSVSTAQHTQDWSVTETGALVEHIEPKWTDFVVALHMNLNAPGLIGYFTVGLAGVAMISLAFSGLLAHPRIFRDAFTLRWGGSSRLQEADLHNRLSVWTLPFNLAISITGAYFGLLSVLIYLVAAVGFGGDAQKPMAAMEPPLVTEDKRPASLPQLDDLIARVKHDGLQAEPFSLFIDRPGTRGQAITIYAGTPRHLRYGEQYYLTAAGDLRRVGFAEGDLGQRLYGAAYPLHFGTFGGLPMKLLYALFGLALTVIVASGVNVWLARRTDQNRPAPRAAHLWNSLVWGVPIATLVSALASMSFSAPPLVAFWIAIGACAAIGLSGRADASHWRWGCALCALSLAVTHLVLNAQSLQLVAWIINFSLIAAGAVVVTPNILRNRSAVRAPHSLPHSDQ